jgi:PKD repeat protein
MRSTSWALAATLVMVIGSLVGGFATGASPSSVAPLPSGGAVVLASHGSVAPSVPSILHRTAFDPKSLLNGIDSVALEPGVATPVPASASIVGSHWTDVNSTTSGYLPILEGAASVWDPVDHEDVVFGGVSLVSATLMANTWAYRNGAWINITAQSAHRPSPRFFPEMAWDAGTNSVILEGGVQSQAIVALSDTWSFVGGNWTNITSTAGSPGPSAAGMMSANGGNALYLFGGVRMDNIDATQPFTWTFTDGLWTNDTVGVQPNTDLTYATGVYDLDGGGILLCGGEADQYHGPSILWFFSGTSTWTNLSSLGSPGLAMAADQFVDDAADHAEVFFGGIDSLGFWQPYTHAFVSGAWQNWSSTTGAPPATAFGVAAEDLTGGIVASGGVPLAPLTIPELSATWNFVPDLSATGSVSSSVANVGETLSFQGAIIGGALPVNSYWTFGDGSISPVQNPTHVYAAPGTFLATFWVTDSVETNASWSTAVSVDSEPLASASASPSTSDVGESVHFSGSESGTYGAAVTFTYDWYLGDGTWAHGTQNPVHAYSSPGNYDIELWVNDSVGGGGTTTLLQVVHTAPTLTASATPASTTAGTPVVFAATLTAGTGPFTYLWNFTDGSWSSASSPSHSFATAGTYKVYLTVTDAAGVTANATATVTVWASLTVAVASNIGAGTVGTSFTFTATSAGGAGGTTYAWSESPATGLGCTASTTATLSCTSATVGQYTVTVSATDSAGHTATASIVVNVLAAASSGSSSSSGFSTTALAVMGVLAVLVLLFAVLWARKGSGSKPAAAAPAAAASATAAPAEPAVTPAAPPPPPPPPQ